MEILKLNRECRIYSELKGKNCGLLSKGAIFIKIKEFKNPHHLNEIEWKIYIPSLKRVAFVCKYKINCYQLSL